MHSAESTSRPQDMPDKSARAAMADYVLDRISAMVAYWNAEQKCVFSNAAYQEWFGRSPEEMVGISMKDLLGPLYEMNLPYIQGALAGERQDFERQIPLPGGGFRNTVATYIPDIVDGVVRGFSVHVTDVTRLRQRKATLVEAIRETIHILEKTKDSFRSKDLGNLRRQLVSVLEQLKQ